MSGREVQELLTHRLYYWWRGEAGGTGIFVLGGTMLLFTASLALIMLTWVQLSLFRGLASAALEASVEAAALRVDADQWSGSNTKKIVIRSDAEQTFLAYIAKNLGTAPCERELVKGPNWYVCEPQAGILTDLVYVNFHITGSGTATGTLETWMRVNIPLADLLDPIPFSITYVSEGACFPQSECPT